MARLVSNSFLRGIVGLPAAGSSRIVSGSSYRNGMRYMATLPSDPDTHEDFLPTNKDIKENPVMIYMKGIPDAPQCGFSALAVRILQQYNVPLSSRNILENPEVKSAVKSFSNWPTFPQVFIKGEFIGGSDIIMQMHQSGELKEKLKI